METIEDIIVEMRKLAKEVYGYPLENGWRTLIEFADRIEKAVKALETDRDNWRRQALVEDARANAATCKDSLQVGNAAKMREALKYLRDASREFCQRILNSKYNQIYDKYKCKEVVKIGDAIVNANIALAESHRNCDLYETENEALKAFHATYPISTYYLYVKWLFAEAEGDAK